MGEFVLLPLDHHVGDLDMTVTLTIQTTRSGVEEGRVRFGMKGSVGFVAMIGMLDHVIMNYLMANTPIHSL